MDNKITVEFAYTNEFGDGYEAKSTFMPTGYGDPYDLGRAFNNFLRQIGYVRKNEYMLTDDLTEDELDTIEEFLIDLRKEKL